MAYNSDIINSNQTLVNQSLENIYSELLIFRF